MLYDVSVRRFTIDSSLLGTTRHIVGDQDGYAWSDSVPRDSWHLTGGTKSSPSVKCLDTLHRLVGKTSPTVPDRYLTAMGHLVTGSVTVPWRHAVPQEVFRIFFRNLVQETTDGFSDLPFDYYETAWTCGSRVLSSLRPVKVDPDVFGRCLEDAGVNSVTLEGFRPKRSGFARPVAYDRFATRTGRLTVSEGPNVLVLKKTHRRMMKSSFDDGVVCSLDFRALEARIVLAEAGRTAADGDMYDSIASDLFGGKVTRDAVKTAVLAELYGISRSSLKARLGVGDVEIDAFVSTIRSHFGTDDLRRRLKEELTSTGRIRNRFGRPLEVPPGQDNLLVNTYAQSSGVDVAMIGFDDVLRRLGDDGIRPLFVLHDAVVLDVRGDRIDDVKGVETAAVTSYERPFPLKFEAF